MVKVTGSYFQNFVAKASEPCPIFTFNLHDDCRVPYVLRHPTSQQTYAVHWSLHSTLRRRSVCSRTGNSTNGVVHATRNRPLAQTLLTASLLNALPRCQDVWSAIAWPTDLRQCSPLTQTINAHGRIVCGSERITLIRGSQILGRSRSHLKIPGARNGDTTTVPDWRPTNIWRLRTKLSLQGYVYPCVTRS